MKTKKMLLSFVLMLTSVLLALSFGTVFSALAASPASSPSVTTPDHPEVEEAVAYKDGKVDTSVTTSDIVIVSSEDTGAGSSAKVEKLKEIEQQLKDIESKNSGVGELNIYGLREVAQKYNKDYDETYFTVVDVIDASIEGKADYLNQSGTYIELTFRTSYQLNDKLAVAYMKDNNWYAIDSENVSEVKTGGLVTVKFDHFCPILFLSLTDTSKGAPSNFFPMWIIPVLIALAVIDIILLILILRKKKAPAYAGPAPIDDNAKEEENPAEENVVEEEAPAEEAAVEDEAPEEAEEALAEEEAPAEEEPVEEAAEEPAEEAPVEEAPAEEEPVEEAPTEEVVEEAPFEEAPAEEPAEEAPVEEAPAEEPVEEAPAEEAPAEDAPQEEKPAEEKPAVAPARKKNEYDAAFDNILADATDTENDELIPYMKKSYTAKLIIAGDTAIEDYNNLRKIILSYDGMVVKESFGNEAFKFKNKIVAKLRCGAKSVALQVKGVIEDKYDERKWKKVSAKGMTTIRVKNSLARMYAENFLKEVLDEKCGEATLTPDDKVIEKMTPDEMFRKGLVTIGYRKARLNIKKG